MLKKIFKRCLAVLLCICVFCGSFVITVFSTDIGSAMDIADFIEYLYDNLGMITFQSGVQIIDGAVSLAQRSKVLVFWRDAVKKYNVSESNFRTMFDIVWQADINTFISKYGDEVYNKCFDTLQDEVKITCRVYSGGLDEICDLIYRSDTNDYKLTEDNDVQVPVPALKDHIQTVNKLYYPKNATGKMSYRIDDRFHNHFNHKLSGWTYKFAELYSGSWGFAPVGGGNDMYIVLFNRFGNNSYFSKYQFHFFITTEDVYFADRDEVEYTSYSIGVEYWDMVDGSQDTAKRHVFSFDNDRCSYFMLDFSFSDSIFLYGYTSYEHFINYSFDSSSYISFPDFNTLYSSDLSQSLYFGCDHWIGYSTRDEHGSSCEYGGNCDGGYVASATPISTLYNIDTTKIPDNYYVTISNDSSTGDTIYNYTLVNPETGQKDTIQNYITNNYTFTTNNEGDTNISGGNGSGGGLGGDVTVGGNVEVGGKVDIGGQVDINVNVKGGNNDNVSLPDTDLVENLPEAPQGFIDYLKKLFDFLPAPVLGVIISGIAAAVICRIWGR